MSNGAKWRWRGQSTPFSIPFHFLPSISPLPRPKKDHPSVQKGRLALCLKGQKKVASHPSGKGQSTREKEKKYFWVEGKCCCCQPVFLSSFSIQPAAHSSPRHSFPFPSIAASRSHSIFPFSISHCLPFRLANFPPRSNF